MGDQSVPEQVASAQRAAHAESGEAPGHTVVILGLGGTIAMRVSSHGSGAAPDAQPDASMFPIPGVSLEFRELANVGSPSLQLEHVHAAYEAAREAVDAGARGVVLTHGTDTLEETAFFLNRLWNHPAPLVLTGAMRPANAPGADGPANVHDAIVTALSEHARGLGVLAVFDSLVHAADRVTKSSSRSVDAFSSEPSGPLAVVNGRSITPVYSLPPRPCMVSGLGPGLPAVPVIGVGLFDRGEALAAILDAAVPVGGVVISGVGMGHVPQSVVPLVRRAVDSGIAVVVATRIAQGGTSTHHYSYPGSEVDLIMNGAVMAGALSPHKARILLQVLVATGASTDEIREAFAAYAY